MRIILFIVLCCSCRQGIAQPDTLQVSYGIRFYTGQTVVHTPSVKNIKGARPFGIELEMAKQHTGLSSFSRSHAYVNTGWAFSYYDFDSSFLGYGMVASRFIEPQYRLSRNIQLGIRATAGIAYLSNPYDPDKNPRNNNYALHVNPYLHLGGSIHYRFSRHLAAGLQSGFHHISNGNIRQPNQGINWITGSISLHYTPGNNELPLYKHKPDQSWKNNKAVVRAGLFYVPRQGYIGRWMAQRNYLVGVFSQVTKQIGGVSAFTAGAENYYNYFKPARGARPVKKGIVAGIQGGSVFFFG